MSPYRPRHQPQNDQYAIKTLTPQLVQPFFVGYVAAGERIPGFRTTSAFFSSLRSNLSLPDDDDYTYSTSLSFPPTFHRSSTDPEPSSQQWNSSYTTTPRHRHTVSLPTFTLPSSSHFNNARRRKWSWSSTSTSRSSVSPTQSIADVDYEAIDAWLTPPTADQVRITLATTTAGRVEAMKLLSRAVLAQRNTATFNILIHPFVISILLLVVLFFARSIYHSTSDLRKTAQTLFILILTTTLVARIAGSWGYSAQATHIVHPAWLNGDELIIAKVRKKRKPGRFKLLQLIRNILTILTIITGPPLIPSPNEPDAEAELHDHIVGVVALSWRPHEGKSTRKGKRVGRGWIRGWMVDIHYRSQGIGSDLLSHATRICQQRRGGGGAGHNKTPDEGNIFFVPDHAFSIHFLPTFWTKWVAKRELWARRRLEEVVVKVNEG